MMAYDLSPGSVHPLGATPMAGGVNFSVYADKAEAVDLFLLDGVDDPRPAQVIRLDPRQPRAHQYWHAFIPGGDTSPSPSLRYTPHTAPSRSRSACSTSFATWSRRCTRPASR
jgi:isoamylase